MHNSRTSAATRAIEFATDMLSTHHVETVAATKRACALAELVDIERQEDKLANRRRKALKELWTEHQAGVTRNEAATKANLELCGLLGRADASGESDVCVA